MPKYAILRWNTKNSWTSSQTSSPHTLPPWRFQHLSSTCHPPPRYKLYESNTATWSFWASFCYSVDLCHHALLNPITSRQWLYLLATHICNFIQLYTVSQKTSHFVIRC